MCLYRQSKPAEACARRSNFPDLSNWCCFSQRAIGDPCGFGIYADRMQVALAFDASTADVTSLGWGGVGMLTFMLSCVTRTTDVMSLGRVGWWGGDVNVHGNLRHAHN